MPTKTTIRLIAIVCAATMLYAIPAVNTREIEVADMKALSKALAAAKPGDVIVMQEGDWRDAVIDFNAVATKEQPITLKAKTPGNVVLSGASQLVFSKPWLVAEGLLFTSGSIQKGTVVEFKSDHCRLTNSAVIDYNPAEKKTGYYWIYFNGNHNRMDHCYFNGKNNMQPLIGNDQDDSRHNTVAYCHFKDIVYTPDNGREIFRIWGYGRSEETGDDGAYFTIEHNLFEQAHGEGTEIISLKSNRNIVRYNTIISTRGGIVGRSGNFNTIEGNYIIGKGQQGSTGIRVAGQGHRVVNNYISDITGDGLILIAGEYIDTALTAAYQPILREGTPLGRVPRYGHVRNGLFANNTFVNIGGVGISIGATYKSSFGSQQRVLIPEGNRIVNNIIYHTGKVAVESVVQDKQPPLDRFQFAPNRFEKNIIYKTAGQSAVAGSGILSANPLLVLQDGLYRPAAGSPVINAGIPVDIKEDMEGQPRDAHLDIGADEVQTAGSKRRPLTAKETGWDVKMINKK